MPTLSVVIASMNEEEGIGECLDAILKAFQTHKIDGEIVLADNSEDTTPRIARSHGAKVVTPDKLGYGHALIYGIDNSSGNYVIVGDADGTYDFSNLDMFLVPLMNDEVDVVIGSRFRGMIKKGAMPWLHRYIGNPLLTFGLNAKLGTHLSDAHCGLRSFTREIWNKIDHKYIPDDFCSEMLKQVTIANARIAEIPIIYYPRKGKVKANTLVHGWRCFSFLTFKILLSKAVRQSKERVK